MYSLLSEWPDLKPNIAIELLNCNFFDIEVRSFAVKCLNQYMKNEDIQTYLLQLVQAIKNESYYDNDLSKFLLRRALESQRLGFDLFWNLKSEMKNPRYKYKFGLLLEAYCRAIGVQLKSFVKQTEVIDNLSTISTFVKKNKENLSLITGPYMKDELEKPQNRKILSNFVNPINKSYVLGAIK
jgi:phosphatidylinositol-4,5-bisphosphate 3-kinase